VHVRIGIDVAPAVERERWRACSDRPQIFADREAAEQIGDLNERAMPCWQISCGLSAMDGAIVSAARAGVRGVEPRYDIEQSRLAAPFADQRMNLAARNRQARVGDGANSAELFPIASTTSTLRLAQQEAGGASPSWTGVRSSAASSGSGRKRRSSCAPMHDHPPGE